MPPATHTVRPSPLDDRHRAAGAKLVPFAGWEMPIQYSGIREEHVAVRTEAGLFDVSHMGQIETAGPDAEAFLQYMLSNDVSRIPPGGAQYSVLCRDDGGVLDDLFTYSLGDRYLTVTNAANHERDLDWLAAHAEGFDVEITDAAAAYAMLALQGPRARSILERHMGRRAPERMRVARAAVAGTDCLVCGTGYTGEDGVELLCPPDAAPSLWDALCADGATPAGLGARDTLRLEACFHLHGHELGAGITPLQAGLGWVVAWDKGDFRGRAALEAERAAGVPRSLRGLETEGRQPPRSGSKVISGGEAVGEVTSGNFSPVLGHGIGLAFVPPTVQAGATVAVEVRGQELPARIVPTPFVGRKPAA